MDKKEYKKTLYDLQVELVKFQRYVIKKKSPYVSSLRGEIQREKTEPSKDLHNI